MEPMKPEVIGKILATRPDVKMEDIREYQKLLAEQLRQASPFAPKASSPAAAPPNSNRLIELQKKLFG